MAEGEDIAKRAGSDAEAFDPLAIAGLSPLRQYARNPRRLAIIIAIALAIIGEIWFVTSPQEVFTRVEAVPAAEPGEGTTAPPSD